MDQDIFKTSYPAIIDLAEERRIEAAGMMATLPKV
jgi:hypothetical protein